MVTTSLARAGRTFFTAWGRTTSFMACHLSLIHIYILAKKPDHWAKGMVLCITVEFYAILSLLASMLMIINISA